MRDEELMIATGCCVGSVMLLGPLVLSTIALTKSGGAARAERRVNVERRLLEMRAELTRLRRGEQPDEGGMKTRTRRKLAIAENPASLEAGAPAGPVAMREAAPA